MTVATNTLDRQTVIITTTIATTTTTTTTTTIIIIIPRQCLLMHLKYVAALPWAN